MTLIQVTQQDINSGKRFGVCNCPVALAVRRATQSIWVAVSPMAINFGENNSIKICNVPQQAKAFMYLFDRGQPVKPFEFELV